MSEFTAGSLRELRISAGLSQVALARLAGVSNVTVGYIEQGRVKPHELTWRKLLKALSPPPEEPGERVYGRQPPLVFLGEVLGRDEFFLRLRPKLSRALAVFFSEFLIVSFLENAEFFSRQRYYPGDFATAVELLGALLKAQKTPAMPAVTEADLRFAKRTCRKKR